MDIPEFVSTIRRYSGLILLLCIGAGIAAYLMSGFLPKRYESEARVLVGSLSNSTYDQLLADQTLAQTFAQLSTTTPVLTNVINSLSLGDTPAQLADRLDVQTTTGLSIIRVTASASTALEAAQVANTTAQQIVALGDSPLGPISAPSIASIVQLATPATSPSSPRTLLNALIAAALGLAIGVGLALVLRQLRGDKRPAVHEPSEPTPSWPT